MGRTNAVVICTLRRSLTLWQRALFFGTRTMRTLLLQLSYFSEFAVVALIPATLACAAIEFVAARSSTTSDEREFFRSLLAVSLLMFVALAIGEGTATFLLSARRRNRIAVLVLACFQGRCCFTTRCGGISWNMGRSGI